MGGLKLAETLGSTITIDIDAAGWGWDVTPGAVDAGRIDLLSVLRHELGHVLGYEHNGSALMSETIEPGATLAGQRLMPAFDAAPPVPGAVAVYHSAHASGVIRTAITEAPRADGGAIVEAIDSTAVEWLRDVIAAPRRLTTADGSDNSSRMPAPGVLELGLALAILAASRRRAVTASARH